MGLYKTPLELSTDMIKKELNKCKHNYTVLTQIYRNDDTHMQNTIKDKWIITVSCRSSSKAPSFNSLTPIISITIVAVVIYILFLLRRRVLIKKNEEVEE